MVISPEEPTGLGELSPFSRTDLRSLNVSDGNLTGSAIRLGVKTDLLSLDQTAHSGALKRSCVDENVFATAIRLDEAEAFLIVIELDSASFHRTSSHELAVLRQCHRQMPRNAPNDKRCPGRIVLARGRKLLGASWPTLILAGHLPRHRRAVSAHEARLAVAFLYVQLRTPLYFAITNASRKFIAAIMLLAGRQVCPR
jgi:hypothetical protein